MEPDTILHTDLLDILFEKRNKAYGAYSLRKYYGQRLMLSIFIVLVCCLLIALIYKTPPVVHRPHPPIFEGPEVFISDPPLPQLKQPPAKQPHRPARQVTNVPPVILPDPEVTRNDETPTMESLENVQIGGADNPGPPGLVVQPTLNQSTAPIRLLEKEPPVEKEVMRVQIEARFPGGQDAWVRFLQRNLDSNIPVENGAPAGNYTVIVSFLVDVEGKISEVKALNDPGYGTAREAVRVINKSSKWMPAIQNGAPVIYRQKESITFRVLEQ